jgi:hypothetical protein
MLLGCPLTVGCVEICKFWTLVLLDRVVFTGPVTINLLKLVHKVLTILQRQLHITYPV